MYDRVVLTRRSLLIALAAAAGCSRSETRTQPASPPSGESIVPPPPPLPPVTTVRTSIEGSVKLIEYQFNAVPKSGPTRAVVIVPNWGDADAKYPVVVAMHGRGEAVKPPALGAMGWAHDYAMTRAFDRLRLPPLTEDDYEGFVDLDRMAETNAYLRDHPFGGLIVACPHVPDMDWSGSGVRAIGRFVTDVLLPQVRKDTPALAAPESTGIDGVSMGGALALRIGLTNPDVFGAVGSLQAAIREEDATELTEIARAARAKRATLKLRLLTSHDDYFRDAIARTSDVWRAAGIDHDFADIPGPHDYAFNRGPGSIELLTWHDRMLVH
jgi:enterochelin esterase-like enzyme